MIEMRTERKTVGSCFAVEITPESGPVIQENSNFSPILEVMELERLLLSPERYSRMLENRSDALSLSVFERNSGSDEIRFISHVSILLTTSSRFLSCAPI